MRNAFIVCAITALFVSSGCNSMPRWDWWRTAKNENADTARLAEATKPQHPDLPSASATPSGSTNPFGQSGGETTAQANVASPYGAGSYGSAAPYSPGAAPQNAPYDPSAYGGGASMAATGGYPSTGAAPYAQQPPAATGNPYAQNTGPAAAGGGYDGGSRYGTAGQSPSGAGPSAAPSGSYGPYPPTGNPSGYEAAAYTADARNAAGSGAPSTGYTGGATPAASPADSSTPPAAQHNFLPGGTQQYTPVNQAGPAAGSPAGNMPPSYPSTGAAAGSTVLPNASSTTPPSYPSTPPTTTQPTGSGTRQQPAPDLRYGNL